MPAMLAVAVAVLVAAVGRAAGLRPNSREPGFEGLSPTFSAPVSRGSDGRVPRGLTGGLSSPPLAPFRAAVNLTVTFGVGALRANQTLAVRLLAQSCLGALLRLSLARAAGGGFHDINATAIDLLEVVPAGGNGSAAPLHSEVVLSGARANSMGHMEARACSGRSLVESCAEDACNGAPVAVVLVRTRLRIALSPPPTMSQLLTDDVAAAIQWPPQAGSLALASVFQHRMRQIFTDDVPYNITIGAFESQWFSALVFSPSFDTTWEAVTFASAVKLGGVEVAGGSDEAAGSLRRQATDAVTVLGILMGIAAVALVGCFACKAQAAHHDHVAASCREADWGGISAPPPAGRPLAAAGRRGGRPSVLSSHRPPAHWTAYPRMHRSWSEGGGSEGDGALELRLPTAALALAAAHARDHARGRDRDQRHNLTAPALARGHSHRALERPFPRLPRGGEHGGAAGVGPLVAHPPSPDDGADPIAVGSRSNSSDELPRPPGGRPASHSFSYFADRRPRLLGSVVAATSSAESELRAIEAGVAVASPGGDAAASGASMGQADISPTLHHIVDADGTPDAAAGAGDDPGRASESTGSGSRRRGTDPSVSDGEDDEAEGCADPAASRSAAHAVATHPATSGGAAGAPAPATAIALVGVGRRPRAGTA
jgi:hypothetical protein